MEHVVYQNWKEVVILWKRNLKQSDVASGMPSDVFPFYLHGVYISASVLEREHT